MDIYNTCGFANVLPIIKYVSLKFANIVIRNKRVKRTVQYFHPYVHNVCMSSLVIAQRTAASVRLE